jgi:hypothetical protein
MRVLPSVSTRGKPVNDTAKPAQRDREPPGRPRCAKKKSTSAHGADERSSGAPFSPGFGGLGLTGGVITTVLAAGLETPPVSASTPTVPTTSPRMWRARRAGPITPPIPGPLETVRCFERASRRGCRSTSASVPASAASRLLGRNEQCQWKIMPRLVGHKVMDLSAETFGYSDGGRFLCDTIACARRLIDMKPSHVPDGTLAGSQRRCPARAPDQAITRGDHARREAHPSISGRAARP